MIETLAPRLSRLSPTNLESDIPILPLRNLTIIFPPHPLQPTMQPPYILLLPILALLLPTSISAFTLTLSVPPNLPPLPPTTRAILTTRGHRIKAPVTRRNTFVFRNLSSPFASASDDATTTAYTTSTSSEGKNEQEEEAVTSYLLDIACRDYDFLSYGVDVGSDGVVRVYRVNRGGAVLGEKVVVGEEAVEVRVLRGREYYEGRAGCRFGLFLYIPSVDGLSMGKEGGERENLGGWKGNANKCITVSPLDLLKNPMILIAVVGLGVVVGMPYLMDSSMSTPLPFIFHFSPYVDSDN